VSRWQAGFAAGHPLRPICGGVPFLRRPSPIGPLQVPRRRPIRARTGQRVADPSIVESIV